MTDAAQLQRVSVPVPENFDPARHSIAIVDKLVEKYGPGWQIETLETEAGTGRRIAVATRRLNLTRVADQGRKTKTVNLGGDVKPTEADKMAARFADLYPGFFMTGWDPHLGKAKLTKLSEDEARCRGAVSVALSCKPWDVQVAALPGGGFDLELPRSYMPSKHDAKLEEVATSVVGREGWFVRIDAKKLTAQIVPSDPPLFPAAIPFPVGKLGKGDQRYTTFAMALPAPGEDTGEPLTIDWQASPFGLLAGTGGSGKSVSIAAIIADQLANGAELAIIDTSDKLVDFLWCKDYCRRAGWGCESIEESAAAAGLIYDEGKRRAKLLREHGVNNWIDLPAKVRLNPILLVVDEVSGLLVKRPVDPKLLKKGHPVAVRVEQENMAKTILDDYLQRILAEMRFVGIRVLLSTQATNANTGVPPSMRTRVGHFMLQGTKPSKAARNQIFPDESAVPLVPDHVQSSGDRSKGVGVAQLEGQSPVVYKSMFATLRQYEDTFARLNLPRTGTAPTAAQVDQYLPKLDEDEEPPEPKRGRGTGNGGGPDQEWKPAGADRFLAENPEFGAQSSYGEDGRRLQGAAAAQAAGKRLDQQAGRR